MSIKGYISLVLHAHIPYVMSHGSWPHGTDWLNEAAAESYIPLLGVFNSLLDDGIKPNIVLSFSPILAYQLSTDEFKSGFKSYLRNRIDTAENDCRGFEQSGDMEKAGLALDWKNFFLGVLTQFTSKYNEDIPYAFRKLKEQHAIEIIPSSATHAYLPLIGDDSMVNLQIKLASEAFNKYFGGRPSGIWLPECAYRPAYKWEYPVSGHTDKADRKGIEEFLEEEEIGYFFVDSHMVEGGESGTSYGKIDNLEKGREKFKKNMYYSSQKGSRSVYNPFYVNSTSEKVKKITAFVRDPAISLQVWSGEWGYPGDGNYLEFHKKNFPGGHRYWKITSAKSDLGEKEIYGPDAAGNMVKSHASHFRQLLKERLSSFNGQSEGRSLLVSPFDAELFGHWWFEGPRWIDEVCRGIHADDEIEMITCSDYLDFCHPQKTVTLPEGSWGEGGSHMLWFNERTEWTWGYIYDAEKIFKSMYRKVSEQNIEEAKPYMGQMLREILLLQSSDWQFLISTSTASDYAEKRICEHFDNFTKLSKVCENILNGFLPSEDDNQFLDGCISRNGIFSGIDVLSFYEY
ncbi:MAG: DUF1957 domain-containing protein [Candidatus Schekmanbacteria bacterium]|nr:DUF1957 domain-containing protein [Candidatus Schekmanbacteria bacterium]